MAGWHTRWGKQQLEAALLLKAPVSCSIAPSGVGQLTHLPGQQTFPQGLESRGSQGCLNKSNG